MQPFGLMNFLKFALQASEQNKTPSTTAPTEGNAPSQGDFSPSFEGENAVDNKETHQPERDTTLPSPNEDAYQAFVEKHKRTAQKIKRENR